jgi:hypothetical protein
MKANILIIIFCCFIFIPVTAANATDLRGRVDGIGAYASAPFPLAKAKIELKQQVDMTIVASYHTGRDGMYYFRNIRPGQYILIVNGQLTVPIQVRETSLQDIGSLLFRY